MGEVYRAKDSKLKRDVAIKVLPESLAANPDALARFEREALAVAALSHPNILSIFDFGTQDGVSYAVMELLEGETLRGKLDASPISQAQAVDYALQVAKGLSAAHEKAFVHRDLKPENLFVTKDGHMKILDFGLVKKTEPGKTDDETSSPTESKHTEPGVVMGTVGYMSPEQVRGLPVDHRSDVFSFGAILYELLSGRKAFKWDTANDTMAAIMRDEPPELLDSGRNVSPALDHIVKHCLEKDRANRFQSAKDIVFALSEASGHAMASGAQLTARPTGKRTVLIATAVIVVLAVAGLFLLRRNYRGGGDEGGVKRIAVLPFENLGSPEDDYFADGITDEIRGKLTSLPRFRVIARGSSTLYKKTTKTQKQIAEELEVGYLLTATVRWEKSGGVSRVHVSPELIEVSGSGAPTSRWQQPFDAALTDVFQVQSDIASRVAQALGVALAPAESTALRQAPTRDLEAYDRYLRALELEKRNLEPSALAQQIKLAGQAVERDPEFAEAIALLARARILNYWLHYDRRASELERARVEAERAVALRPNATESHLALGYYHYQGRLDYDAALAEFNKALAIQPNNALVRSAIGYVKRRQGRMDEAGAELRKAIDGDPRNGSLYYNLGETQLLSHEYSEAIRNIEVSTSLNPTHAQGYGLWILATILWRGDVTAAEKVLKKAAEVPNLEDPYGLVYYWSVRTALVARDADEALRRLNAQRREASGDQGLYVPLSLLRAETLSYMERRDPARQAYEEARGLLAAKIDETPEDARFHSSLGVALAGLGRAAEAVREGERGVALMPPTRDAYRGAYRVEDLARIYAMVGNQEASVQQLDYLLSHPSWISATLLKLDPRWDPLRKNPKFEALLAKYEVKR